jgi:broad specificity polyphosphatase/5'/3'-nucleotidase SurE
VPVGELEDGTDISAVAEKFISMTPVHLDLTAYQSMELLQRIALDLSPKPVTAAPGFPNRP